MPVVVALVGFLAGAFTWPGAPAVENREITAREDAQRLRAVLGLALEEPVRARALLVPALKDRDPGVRMVAARLLLRRGAAAEAVEAATAWLGATGARERMAGLQVLRDADELPQPARRAVERALRDGDVATRVLALDVLAAHGAGASLVPILGALDDEHRDVRARAARALGTTRDARAALPLLARVSDGDRQVQSQAVVALGALGNRRAVPALLRLVGDVGSSGLDLRGAAIEALGRLGDPAAVPTLASIARRGPLDDGARRALGEIGSPEAVDLLVSLAREAPVPPDLRGALELAGARALPRLVAEVASGPTGSASLAAEVLGRLGDRRATPALVAAVERRAPAAPAALAALARLADPASLPALAHAASDSAEPAERRVLALDALAAIGDDRAQVAVPRALADGERNVRVAALRLAGALGGSGATPDVAARLGDADAVVRREAALVLARLPPTEPRGPAAWSPVEAILAALAAAGRPPGRAADDVTLRALGESLEQHADARAAAAIERAYLTSADGARTALARGLVAAHATAPLASGAVIDALIRDLGGPGELALAAADALAGAQLSTAQADALAAAAPRAEDDVQARLFPALARGPGLAQVIGVLRDPDAGTERRAAAAWALSAASDARAALREAAAAADGPVAANARAALAAIDGGPARTRATWVGVRVLAADGAPWPGRWLTVTPPGGVAIWAPTDLDGRARVGGLPEGAPALRLQPE
jgi:HEAT repeat protein